MKKIPLTIILFFLSLTNSLASPKYISLAPSTTEILFALGLDEEIVGVSTYCSYPLQAQSKTKVGDFSSPNLEKIFILKPDYIFCTGLEQAPVINELKRMNFKVYVSDPANFTELFKSINDIGRITNKVLEAQVLIDKMKNDIEAVNSKIRVIPREKRVKVFLEIWHEPLMTIGKGSFMDELITLAGGINIAAELPRPYSKFSAEKVVHANPGCIIMAYMDKKPALQLTEVRLGWSGIDAVKNKRVFNDIDPDLLLRPGPRITQGLKEIYKRLYSY